MSLDTVGCEDQQDLWSPLLSLLEQHEQNLVGVVEATRSVRLKVSALELYGYVAPGAASEIEEVTEWLQIREFVEKAAVYASRQMLWMHPPVTARQILVDSLSRHEAGADSGVTIRAIHQSSATDSERVAGPLKRVSRLGIPIEVRTAPLVPFRFIVVDEALALVWPTESTRSTAGRLLLVRRPSLVKLFRRVFEYCWNGTTNSLPSVVPIRHSAAERMNGVLQTGFNESPLRLSEQQLTILRLWARGRQDAAIAREMDISERTLRRLIAALLRRLGVGSRFEAGVLVGRIHGLLDFPTEPAMEDKPISPAS